MTSASIHSAKTVLLSGLFAMLLSRSALAADPAVGIWQTEGADSGGYLHVQIEPCGDKLCGLILRAYDENGDQVDDYEHLGKAMIMDMQIIGKGRYAKGRIWAPDVNKTYRSKMQLAEQSLIVKGCVAFICRSQSWTAVP